MKGLFLYGSQCKGHVWNQLKPYLKNIDIDYVEYTHEITQRARNVGDVASWVYEKYKNEKYDFILGHSMGGLIALYLVSELNMDVPKLILLESSPVPSKQFYRNLMLPANMEKYGEKVIGMLKEESKYYNTELLGTLQDEFDEKEQIRNYSGQIDAIFGDRGVSEYADRINDLCLPADITDKIRLHFVANACHMPMIENPRGLAEDILKIVGSI